MVKLCDVIADDQLHAVFFRDGSRQLVATGQDEELPVAIDTVAFAASLYELDTLVGEMREHMASDIDASQTSGLVLKPATGSI